MRSVVVAMLLLLAGCECFPGARVRGSSVARFDAHFCGRETPIHRIEFRSASNEVLWRVDADDPVIAESIDGDYGVVPPGFKQTFPRTGTPGPLVVGRGSMIVYADRCALPTPFCWLDGRYEYDFDQGHWAKDYMKP